MKITIARECGCYGDEVGQVLADRLNVPLYNKKTLTELAKKKGILEHYPDYFGENPAGTLLAVIAEDDGEDSVVHRTQNWGKNSFRNSAKNSLGLSFRNTICWIHSHWKRILCSL